MHMIIEIWFHFETTQYVRDKNSQKQFSEATRSLQKKRIGPEAFRVSCSSSSFKPLSRAGHTTLDAASWARSTVYECRFMSTYLRRKRRAKFLQQSESTSWDESTDLQLPLGCCSCRDLERATRRSSARAGSTFGLFAGRARCEWQQMLL